MQKATRATADLSHIIQGELWALNITFECAKCAECAKFRGVYVMQATQQPCSSMTVSIQNLLLSQFSFC